MVIQEGLFRDILRLFVWFPLRWLILVLPVSWGITLLRTMGDIHYRFSKGKREMLINNLARLKGSIGSDSGGDEEIIKEYFQNHYIDHLLIFIFPKFGHREIEQFIEITGIEYLDEALEKDKGVILIHGHFGPVHLPLVVLARLGYRMKQIGFPSDEGLSWIGRNVTFRLRLKYEAKMPADIIKANSFLRPAFRWLNENGIIMITGDGTGTDRRLGKHRTLPFFGHRLAFPLGPGILASKTDSTMLPIFIVPGVKKLYKIIIERPLTSNRSGQESILDITDQFVRKLEDYVFRYPGYMHFLDRFSPGEIIQ